MSVHLNSCAECRQREAIYRQAGERVRQLPAITPPPEFRARVFAAIRAEELRVAPDVARLARAATDPALPAIRPVRPIPLRARRQRVALTVRSAMAIAAVLVLTLVTARVLPLLGASPLSKSAASLNGAGLNTASGNHLAHYALPAGYTFASSALATASWLVYSATDSTRGSTLLAVNRRTKRTLSLLAAPSSLELTVRALTSDWVIWSAGAGTSSGSWLLQADRLPSDGVTASAPVTLVDSSTPGADTPETLGGVWAAGSAVLVSAATRSGAEVLRFDLSAATPQMSVIARSTNPGHLLTDPSADNGTYYWADVWFDGASGLHSVVWQSDSAGHSSEISGDNAAFHPRATHGMLVWVEVAPDALAHMSPVSGVAAADDDELLLDELNGSLQARNLGNGQQWQVSDRADVTSVEAGNSLLLWQSDSQTHLYNLPARSAGTLDGQVRGAAFAAASGTTVVWQPHVSSDLYVYDAS
ncbi:MAG: anti-sigma factor family protein [Ktedonobacterales bacterium]